MAIRKTPESYVLASIREYLAVKRIRTIRMQAGAVQDRRGIPVRMHSPGTADLLAFVPYWEGSNDAYIPTWIEAKAPNGKQSTLQKEFQESVEADGHRYILAYGIDDLVAAGL